MEADEQGDLATAAYEAIFGHVERRGQESSADGHTAAEDERVELGALSELACGASPPCRRGEC